MYLPFLHTKKVTVEIGCGDIIADAIWIFVQLNLNGLVFIYQTSDHEWLDFEGYILFLDAPPPKTNGWNPQNWWSVWIIISPFPMFFFKGSSSWFLGHSPSVALARPGWPGGHYDFDPQRLRELHSKNQRRCHDAMELLDWKQQTALGVWTDIYRGGSVSLKWSESYGRYVLKLCFFVVKQWIFIVTKISDFLLTWSSLGLFHDIPLGTTPSSSLRPGWQFCCWKEN